MLRSLRICCAGSIGIIALPQLILTLRLAYGTEITCFLTPAARNLITEHAFSAITGRLARIELGEDEALELSDIPLLVAPASADALVAMAMGRADHVAARLAMSSRAPVFICPAMNVIMWEQPPTRRAVNALREFGYVIIGPAAGTEIETLSPSTSSLADVDTIIGALVAELPWSP